MSSNNYNNFIDSANSSEPVDEPIDSTNTSDPENLPYLARQPWIDEPMSSSSSTFYEPVEPIVSTNTSEPEAQPQGPVMEDEVSTPCRQFSQSQFGPTEDLHTSDLLPAIYANPRPGTSRSSSNPCRQFSQSQFEASEELHTSDVLPAIYANQRPGTSRSSSNPCRQQSDTIDLVSDDDSPIPPHVSAESSSSSTFFEPEEAPPQETVMEDGTSGVKSTKKFRKGMKIMKSFIRSNSSDSSNSSVIFPTRKRRKIIAKQSSYSQSQFGPTEDLHTSDLLPAIYANPRPGPSRSSSTPCRQQSDTIDLVSDDDSPIPPHVSVLPVSKDNIELIDLVSDSSDE